MVKVLSAFTGLAAILALLSSASSITENRLEARGDTEVGDGRRPPSRPRDYVELSGLEKRAPGPSGQLLQPAGGTSIYTEVNWPGSGA